MTASEAIGGTDLSLDVRQGHNSVDVWLVGAMGEDLFIVGTAETESAAWADANKTGRAMAAAAATAALRTSGGSK